MLSTKKTPMWAPVTSNALVALVGGVFGVGVCYVMFARLGFWWGADRWNCPSVDHDAYRSAMLSNSDKMGASPEPRFTGMFNESPSVSQASHPYDPYDL